MTGSPLVHPFHISLEAAGHRLIRRDDGDVDIFRLDEEFHNGPECEFCGEQWCHHCGGEIIQCVKAHAVITHAASGSYNKKAAETALGE